MAEAQPEIISEDSDSEVEYSDALDLDCNGDGNLKSDELKNLGKSKVQEKQNGNDDFFDTEDHEKSDEEEEEDDRPVDHLKERKESEEKLTDEEREVRKLSRGEICVATFIPPGNGASLGSFWFKIQVRLG